MNAFFYPSKRGINFAKIRGFKVTDYRPGAPQWQRYCWPGRCGKDTTDRGADVDWQTVEGPALATMASAEMPAPKR